MQELELIISIITLVCVAVTLVGIVLKAITFGCGRTFTVEFTEAGAA